MRRTFASLLVMVVIVPGVSAHAQEAGTVASSTTSVSEVPSAAPRLETAPALLGGTGLLRTQSAGHAGDGRFSLGATAEYFTGTDVVRAGDEETRFLGHFALTAGLGDHVELFGSLSARTSQNTLGQPQLIQSLGDFTLGVKGFSAPIEGMLRVGGLLRTTMPAVQGAIGLEPGKGVFDLWGLATADFAKFDVPVRAHLNTGYTVDGTNDLFDYELTRIERFGHHVYGYDRWRIGVGAEAPLDWMSPFLEYTLDIPVGPPCRREFAQQCLEDVGFSGFPSFVSLGARVTPYKGLGVLTAFDFGLTTDESQGTPAVPAWNFVFGVTYAFEPNAPPQVIERVVEVPVETASASGPSSLGYVQGRVLDGATKQPVTGARIRYLETKYTDQITGPDGSFRTFDLPVGEKYVIEVSHPEYVTRAMRVTIAVDPLSGDIELQQAFEGSRVVGAVTGRGSRPIGGMVHLRGAEAYDVVADPDDGGFQLDVPPGEYVVIASAPGHLSVRETIILRPERREVSFTLEPLPEGTVWRLAGDELVIDDPMNGVAFDGDKLATSSVRTLTQIGEFLKANPRVSVLVRSHTDAGEDAAKDVTRTEKRASTVASELGRVGVPAERIRTEGVGSSEPLLPNISERNRARNNRVEFVILYTP